MKPLYRAIAEAWRKDEKARLVALVANHLPNEDDLWTTTLDRTKSSEHCLVFHVAYHHHTDRGPAGWTDHTVTVRASLCRPCVVEVGGRDRDGIKNTIARVFRNCLDSMVDDDGNGGALRLGGCDNG
jgi:hypothetical protein